MKSRFDAHCYAIAIIILGLAIAFLPGSCDRVEGNDSIRWIGNTGHHQLSFSANTVRYKADVIADLDQFLREHGDNSRLLRIIDNDARTVIYVLLNSTGDMFTGLQVIPSTAISPHSPLYKRWRRQWDSQK